MIGRIWGMSRARFGTDGPGITTLVGMFGCPLNCAYCINNPISNYSDYTIEELYNAVKVDALYFEATGGGICFGGHEPLLQQTFLKEFIRYVKSKNHNWKFGLETSLSVILDFELLSLLDFIIVDIKSLNSEVYRRYTEMNNEQLLQNLELIKNKVPDIKIRIPNIPGYTTEDDVEASKCYLRSLGYEDEQFDIFMYKTELEESDETV